MDSAAAEKFVDKLEVYTSRINCSNEIIIAPSFPFIPILSKLTANMKIAAQDCSEFSTGAYTGDVSARQLKDIGCKYVIIGHSERRQYHKETNEQIYRKAVQILENHMLPVICIGETLEEKEQNKTAEVLIEQIRNSLPDRAMKKIIIAYEPVWAIGTGKVPSVEDISFVNNLIYNQLKEFNSFENNHRILYGGSVKSSNSLDIMKADHISGLLIGGASLKSEEFKKIIDLLN